MRQCGYEPHVGDQAIRLGNGPFDGLVNEHRDLVCAMNLALVQGLTDGIGASDVESVLEPQPGCCCVALQVQAA